MCIRDRNWKFGSFKAKVAATLNSLGQRLKSTRGSSDTTNSATALSRQQKRLRKDSNTNMMILNSSRNNDVYDLEKNDPAKHLLGNDGT